LLQPVFARSFSFPSVGNVALNTEPLVSMDAAAKRHEQAGLKDAGLTTALAPSSSL
jgi:hypothetical protein